MDPIPLLESTDAIARTQEAPVDWPTKEPIVLAQASFQQDLLCPF